jgi:hypothetical protein
MVTGVGLLGKPNLRAPGRFERRRAKNAPGALARKHDFGQTVHLADLIARRRGLRGWPTTGEIHETWRPHPDHSLWRDSRSDQPRRGDYRASPRGDAPPRRGERGGLRQLGEPPDPLAGDHPRGRSAAAGEYAGGDGGSVRHHRRRAHAHRLDPGRGRSGQRAGTERRHRVGGEPHLRFGQPGGPADDERDGDDPYGGRAVRLRDCRKPGAAVRLLLAGQPGGGVRPRRPGGSPAGDPDRRRRPAGDGGEPRRLAGARRRVRIGQRLHRPRGRRGGARHTGTRRTR